ncbi:hypothetical protein D3C72_1297820 [compost metagenome]
MSCRRSRNVRRSADSTSLPCSIARPEMRAPSISRSSALPVVVLPQPDSPSSASVSPARNENVTPSTALTQDTMRRNGPLRTG